MATIKELRIPATIVVPITATARGDVTDANEMVVDVEADWANMRIEVNAYPNGDDHADVVQR